MIVPREPSELERRRGAAIHASRMHADAVAIVKAAQKLQELMREFIETHEADETNQIFRDAGCETDTDGGRDRDLDCQWSEFVCQDVAGFAWSLDVFLSVLDAEIYPGDPASVTVDVPAVVEASPSGTTS